MQQLNKRGGRISALETNRGTITGDDYVVAAGNGSGPLLGHLGVRVPLCALKGYSLTLPYPEKQVLPLTSASPTTGTNRLCPPWPTTAHRGDGGHRLRRRPTAREPHSGAENIVARSFPELEGLDKAEAWTGMRPSTPAGPPMLGRAGYPNLWMNLGQGSLGFTLAAGSAVVLGALIDNQALTISLEGLTWKQPHDHYSQ